MAHLHHVDRTLQHTFLYMYVQNNLTTHVIYEMLVAPISSMCMTSGYVLYTNLTTNSILCSFHFPFASFLLLIFIILIINFD